MLSGSMLATHTAHISKLPEIIVAIVNGLIEGVSAMVEAGKELVSGIWEGIKGAWGDLVKSVTELGKKLVDKVRLLPLFHLLHSFPS